MIPYPVWTKAWMHALLTNAAPFPIPSACLAHTDSTPYIVRQPVNKSCSSLSLFIIRYLLIFVTRFELKGYSLFIVNYFSPSSIQSDCQAHPYSTPSIVRPPFNHKLHWFITRYIFFLTRCQCRLYLSMVKYSAPFSIPSDCGAHTYSTPYIVRQPFNYLNSLFVTYLSSSGLNEGFIHGKLLRTVLHAEWLPSPAVFDPIQRTKSLS